MQIVERAVFRNADVRIHESPKNSMAPSPDMTLVILRNPDLTFNLEVESSTFPPRHSRKESPAYEPRQESVAQRIGLDPPSHRSGTGQPSPPIAADLSRSAPRTA